MFREMRRNKQQISQDACIEVLMQAPRGVLSVCGDDGYPYGMPITHYYCPTDGHIYFHGAKAGHKYDALLQNDKVSFCAYDEGFRKDGEWALNIRSVVVFGRAKPVADKEKALHICTELCHKFTDDETYIQKEWASAGERVLVYEIIPEHMTGKLVNES